MPREPKVTLTLTEADARWLSQHYRLDRLLLPEDGNEERGIVDRFEEELYHALAECECAEETR